VRINHEELSIHDPSFYSELYVSGAQRRSEHYDAFVKGIGFDGECILSLSLSRSGARFDLNAIICLLLLHTDSHILTVDHDLHRQRRKPMDPFFSRIGVQRLQAMLAEVALKMETRLREFQGAGQVVRLDHVFSAFSSDVMCRICLSNHNDAEKRDDFLDHPEFVPEWYVPAAPFRRLTNSQANARVRRFNCIVGMVKALPLFTGFPWLIHIASHIPMSVLFWVLPAGQDFDNFRKFSLESIHEAVRVKDDNDRKGISTDDKGSVFLHLANSDMPQSERKPERLVKEAQVLLAGGTVTTSHTLG
jgi:hypothetical protein